ncbi:valine--tRNA ligase [Helcococcus kunzii]|uniref:valine--tRNA ligase n=1 Tax=Helcococcus kunzii TaxID=40091 RepID=UPI0021A7B7F3|nr:valine--tRNA ligase [Helcococcus kunzii]MCT1796754.1 valine--tRNA ligase [Helcococcus kunzii]MCT1988858.1 valine--tRNA ligase [Helcococcus kunzii]
MKNLEKNYNPKSFEDRIYKEWEDGEYFKAIRDKSKEPFTIVMPPPNVTGNLHMGHALVSTLQDIVIRWKRMSGYSTLWLPGTDHASIATEAKVVQKIRSEGHTKEELGREKFLEEAWDWTRKYGGNIKKQLRKIGVSADWSREAFTLDENLSEAVEEVFVKMYNDGLIYKGEKIVNYCTDCNTSISDAEVDHIDEKGHLWYFDYPLKDGSGKMTIATSRPETMLGDLAVAVDPTDERYTSYVGKTLILPIVGREIPIIADEYVDKEFGTGCVKITPSHDPNDFEVGERHNLGQCIVIENDATISEGYGEYSGLNRFEAREKIVKEMDDLGLLVKIEDIEHAVGHCSRCGTVIEPLVSKQWFVAMETLKKPALEAYKNGELKIIPERFGKIYVNWLENLRDWNISRQLWWGHRIPVYYTEDGEIIVSKTKPDESVYGPVTRDEATLDTWFSSALWPFSTLGWPNEAAEDYKYFFPTNTLITGYDIIMFWVIRMIFSSLYNTGKLPFKTVYLNGIVRDAQGRKMSKSLDNGIDPLDEIEKYGADALRFNLVSGNSPGNDMRYIDTEVKDKRNFANKLWNASRYIFMNLEDDKEYILDRNSLTIEDKWIISRINTLSKDVDRLLNQYEIGIVAKNLYEFIWFEFCDWYIEFTKTRLQNEGKEKDNVLAVLLYSLDKILRLLHPYMPFITEEIYSFLPNIKTEEKIINAKYPIYEEENNYEWEEKAISKLIDAITSIRAQKSELNVPHKNKSKLFVFTESDMTSDIFTRLSENLVSLASLSEVEVIREDRELENVATIIKDDYKLYLSLEGLIDNEKELKRLNGEKKKIISEIERAKGKLSNEKFTSKAPEKLVNEEKAKVEKYSKMLAEVEKSISEIESKI